jgi:hypothetical protein
MSSKQKQSKGWRVVYGETMPAWERIFPTQREAKVFAKEHESFGDIIFSVAKAYDGEPPKVDSGGAGS